MLEVTGGALEPAGDARRGLVCQPHDLVVTGVSAEDGQQLGHVRRGGPLIQRNPDARRGERAQVDAPGHGSRVHLGRAFLGQFHCDGIEERSVDH